MCLTEGQAKAQGIKVKKGLFPWSASGRAIANGRDEGFTKLLFDDSPEAHGHGKILGGGIVGTHAGDMIGEIALAIEMGADAVDIGKTIHPHPTLGESIGSKPCRPPSEAWRLVEKPNRFALRDPVFRRAFCCGRLVRSGPGGKSSR